MAGNQMFCPDELRHLLAAVVFGDGAAVGEGAAGIGPVGGGDFTPQDDSLPLPFHHGVGNGGGGEEGLRVRMTWMGVQGGGRGEFHDAGEKTGGIAV